MTSLPTLLISFAIAGLILTWLTHRAGKTSNLLFSFLQHFTGVWFVFSGLVKAVDPIGTAYKMEDYFAAFQGTFEGLNNVFANLAPLFPLLSNYSTGFSILMIILEIALGIMLMLGYLKRITAWLFFLVVLFFTVLTGFTYLTGFVPAEANFFDFSKWGPYIATQMRVTDCGCFGDFIKLDPKVSFFKDLGLMIPAILFIWRSGNLHQLFSAPLRSRAVGATAAFSLVFCIWNAYLALPVVDFRPFKVGAHIRERKALEEEARSNVEIIGWVMENSNTGKIEKAMIPMERYKELVAQYPKEDGWRIKDQIKTEPFIEQDGKRVPVTETKISDFAIEDPQNGDVTEDLLQEPGYSLMIVAYKLPGAVKTEVIERQDTVWVLDTVQVARDSFAVTRSIQQIVPVREELERFYVREHYANTFRNEVNPLAEAAKAAGWKVYALVTYTDSEHAADFIQQVGAGYPYYVGDDKLLKTIIRANPGIVVLKDGKVLDMYHHRDIPDFGALGAKWK